LSCCTCWALFYCNELWVRFSGCLSIYGTLIRVCERGDADGTLSGGDCSQFFTRGRIRSPRTRLDGWAHRVESPSSKSRIALGEPVICKPDGRLAVRTQLLPWQRPYFGPLHNFSFPSHTSHPSRSINISKIFPTPFCNPHIISPLPSAWSFRNQHVEYALLNCGGTCYQTNFFTRARCQ
jgi:hypothetical protein